MKFVFLFFVCVVGVYSFPERRQAAGCNSFCPMYIIEFCGSDGKTYHSNECFLKSQFCNEGRNDFDSFHTLHYGACTGDELTGGSESTETPVTIAATDSTVANDTN